MPRRAGQKTERAAGKAEQAGRKAAQAGEATRDAGQRAAHSEPLAWLGRFGLLCRGVLYCVVGFLAIEIAFGRGGQEADSQGALRTVAATPVGTVALWLLAVGFAGLACWQLAEALFDAGRGAGHRLGALGRAVLYGVLCASTVATVAGHGGGSSDAKSKDATAHAMAAPGGRFLVAAAGVAILVTGGVLVVKGVRRSFRDGLAMQDASVATRRLVEGLGLVGNVARGVVFASVGVFVAQAALTFDPAKARGLDGSLRAFAHSPLGPAALVVVALGLVTFGLFSALEARWHRN